jgi:hypothetical protein
MDITMNLAVYQRHERVADKHVAQPESKKQPILVDALRSEGRYVKRIGDKGIGEDGHRCVQLLGRIFFYFNMHFLLPLLL